MRFNSDKSKYPPLQKNGILLVDKQPEWTSHDVVNFIRRTFNVPKVGHCGTLDPAATGLLVVVLGKFTKLSQKFSGEDKVYTGTIILGRETDSQDMDGNVIAENDFSSVTEEALREAFASFVGDYKQLPPMVSAVKKDGAKLYELARKGIEIERDPKDVTIYSIDVSNVNLPYADFRVACSKGTYIRTLCSDVGKKLSCGAALFKLNRVKSGEFDLADAHTIEEIKAWTQDDLARAMDDFLFNKLSKIARFTAF